MTKLYVKEINDCARCPFHFVSSSKPFCSNGERRRLEEPILARMQPPSWCPLPDKQPSSESHRSRVRKLIQEGKDHEYNEGA